MDLSLHTLRPGQNGSHFKTFCSILIQISFKFVSKGRADLIIALAQVMQGLTYLVARQPGQVELPVRQEDFGKVLF